LAKGFSKSPAVSNAIKCGCYAYSRLTVAWIPPTFFSCSHKASSFFVSRTAYLEKRERKQI
jgi:hypothetical protein